MVSSEFVEKLEATPPPNFVCGRLLIEEDGVELPNAAFDYALVTITGTNVVLDGASFLAANIETFNEGNISIRSADLRNARIDVASSTVDASGANLAGSNIVGTDISAWTFDDRTVFTNVIYDDDSMVAEAGLDPTAHGD